MDTMTDYLARSTPVIEIFGPEELSLQTGMEEHRHERGRGLPTIVPGKFFRDGKKDVGWMYYSTRGTLIHVNEEFRGATLLPTWRRGALAVHHMPTAQLRPT